MNAASPSIPELPILTPDRIATAVLHFMSQEISIEEAAHRKMLSDTTLRERINNDEVYSKSVMVRGFKKDKTPIVKTTMRLQWLAEDEDARATGEYLKKKHQKFSKNKSPGLEEEIKVKSQSVASSR